MSRAVLVDLVRCMGCRSCQVACKAWNDNPAELTQCLGCYDNPPGFSADTWSLIQFNEVEWADRLHFHGGGKGFSGSQSRREAMERIKTYPAPSHQPEVGCENSNIAAQGRH